MNIEPCGMNKGHTIQRYPKRPDPEDADESLTSCIVIRTARKRRWPHRGRRSLRCGDVQTWKKDAERKHTLAAGNPSALHFS